MKKKQKSSFKEYWVSYDGVNGSPDQPTGVSSRRPSGYSGGGSVVSVHVVEIAALSAGAVSAVDCSRLAKEVSFWTKIADETIESNRRVTGMFMDEMQKLRLEKLKMQKLINELTEQRNQAVKDYVHAVGFPFEDDHIIKTITGLDDKLYKLKVSNEKNS